MAKIKIEGLDKLQKKLAKDITMEDVKREVKKNGAGLQKKIVEKAEFRGHYKGNKFVKPTGTTKKSVTLDITDGGFTAEAGPTIEYAPYLEYGTRFMDAQPFVQPALEEQLPKFKSDMKKLVR